MKKVLLIALFCLFAKFAVGQQGGMETRLCFTDTTSFNFTDDWQYLSTDIYLFNGQQFNRVINDLYLSPDKKGKKRGLANEELEYLYMTAQLVNVKYFGDNQVVYPLYNFQINKNKENKYQTYVNDNIESIRIIDNLPLYSASNNIDAKIDVKATTFNDRDNILGFFGRQLKNLASMDRPGVPILSLIGEMGSFIESNARKKEYKFSSTIRLFEQKNFDQRLHSVRIYAIVTPNTPAIRITTTALEKFMDTCSTTEFSKDLLRKLIPYKAYPLIIIANYKSQYQMEGVSGDEVNTVTIDRRKVTIENNYRDKLINEETYKQEKNFIDFLTLFSNFKSKLELYTLNARTGNSEAANKSLEHMLESYVSMMQEFDVVKYKYRNNKTFITTFMSEYASIVDFASYYLENDHHLRGAKVMANTLISINKNGIPTKYEEKENALRYLRFIDNFSKDFKEKIKEGKAIVTLIKQIENNILTQEFQSLIYKLDATPATSDKDVNLKALNERMSSTHCMDCREKAKASIKNYYNRLEVQQKLIMVEQHREVLAENEIKYLALAKEYYLLKDNVDRIFKNDTNLESDAYRKRYQEIERDMSNYRNLLDTNINDLTSSVIGSIHHRMDEILQIIKTNFEFIRVNKPELLEEYVPETVSIFDLVESEKVQESTESTDNQTLENND